MHVGHEGVFCSFRFAIELSSRLWQDSSLGYYFSSANIMGFRAFGGMWNGYMLAELKNK